MNARLSMFRSRPGALMILLLSSHGPAAAPIEPAAAAGKTPAPL